MGLGRLAQAGWPNPFCEPFATPVDLDDPQTIYSPPAKSHRLTHSPFSAEEQRRERERERERERDHPGEERIELVV
jgi:hypothetical protein